MLEEKALLQYCCQHMATSYTVKMSTRATFIVNRLRIFQSSSIKVPEKPSVEHCYFVLTEINLKL